VPLELTGFSFGKSAKTRKINKIEFQSVAQLKKTLHRGMLFLVPKSQLFDTAYSDDLPDLDTDRSMAADVLIEEESESDLNSITEHEEKNTAADAEVVGDVLSKDGDTDINKTRLLRQQQDEEFQLCLKQDREKSENVELERRKEIYLQVLREQRKQKVVDEPVDGFIVKINHGTAFVYRKCTESSPVEVLLNFVGALECASEFFRLFIPGTKLALYSHKQYGTMRDVGIRTSCSMQVRWLNEEDMDGEDMDVGDENDDAKTDAEIENAHNLHSETIEENKEIELISDLPTME
ncbi:uncharacterized protein LOC117318743, partial [Pecten maximus]|uniref:uncharacterized protein LOC117318743 n=1 Tax=Pecten maximus TaxID=6579 RepID=UPI001458AF9A